MAKTKKEQITYARQKLISLVDNRQLRKWCLDNNLVHATCYKIAAGITKPTYRMVSTMIHLIPPAEWIYYTDEEIPYSNIPLPRWNSTQISKYIRLHGDEYKEISAKYGFSEKSAYFIFFKHCRTPSIKLIRMMRNEVNPAEFFTTCDLPVQEADYVPDRGDIVSVADSLQLVISAKENNNSQFLSCKVIGTTDGGINLKGTVTNGSVQVDTITTFNFKKVFMIEKVPAELLEKVMVAVRKQFI